MDVREKLVESVGQVQDCGCDVTDVVEMNYVENINLADHLIANGVTVQEWIPVTERLPEVGKKVLVYCKENKNDYEIGAYSDTYRGFFVRQTCYENITHWMPLPQPPKGE